MKSNSIFRRSKSFFTSTHIRPSGRYLLDISLKKMLYLRNKVHPSCRIKLQARQTSGDPRLEPFSKAPWRPEMYILAWGDVSVYNSCMMLVCSCVTGQEASYSFCCKVHIYTVYTQFQTSFPSFQPFLLPLWYIISDRWKKVGRGSI